MWRSRRTFALPVLSALVRHPSLAAKVLSRRSPNSNAGVGVAGAVV